MESLTRKKPFPGQETTEPQQASPVQMKQPKINMPGPPPIVPPAPASPSPMGFQPLPQQDPGQLAHPLQQDPYATGGENELVKLLKGLLGNAQ